MFDNKTITIANKKTKSAILSSFAPLSLSCFRLLATIPSNKSLIHPDKYKTQKTAENGVAKTMSIAKTIRETVIVFAIFLIESSP